MSEDERDKEEEGFEELDDIKEIRENYVRDIKERERKIQDKAEKYELKIQQKEEELMDLEHEIADYVREYEKNPSEDLSEEIDDKKEERFDLLEEIRELKEEAQEEIVDRKQDLRERRQELAEKIREKEHKARMRVKKAEYKARKVRAKVARINISVPPDTSEEWREWSEDLGSSVSELVRKSMRFVKNNIGDLRKLDEFGKQMEKWGENIEKAVEESGVQDSKGSVKPKPSTPSASEDKERIKRRLKGLIKLQKGIPIDKFAQALNKSDEFAENIIYELVAEGVEGELDEGVFKFSGEAEEVLTILFELIDKI